MQMLLDMRNQDESVLDHPWTASTRTYRAPLDKVHPSIKKGVEFKMFSSADHGSARLRPSNQDRVGGHTDPINNDEN